MPNFRPEPVVDALAGKARILPLTMRSKAHVTAAERLSQGWVNPP